MKIIKKKKGNNSKLKVDKFNKNLTCWIVSEDFLQTHVVYFTAGKTTKDT